MKFHEYHKRSIKIRPAILRAIDEKERGIDTRTWGAIAAEFGIGRTGLRWIRSQEKTKKLEKIQPKNKNG